MDYSGRRLVPYIPPAEYDKVAQEFLETYYPQALTNPMPVPIEDIAKNVMGLDVQYVCLSEEQDIYGMTIFTDGAIEIYDPVEGLYDTQVFKSKTVLIDPEAVKKTNSGCKNNTIAHECVHWYKHRLFYKRQQFTLPRYAKYCKCRVSITVRVTMKQSPDTSVSGLFFFGFSRAKSWKAAFSEFHANKYLFA